MLQWRYHTANSWGNDEHGTGLGYGHQEEFYGCADVEIINTTGKPTEKPTLAPTTTTTSTTMLTTTSKPTTEATTKATTTKATTTKATTTTKSDGSNPCEGKERNKF